MRKIILGLMAVVMTAPLVLATPALAQPDPAYVSPNKEGGAFSIVPCGRHANNPNTPEDETAPCSICHIVVLGNNIVKYLLYIGVAVAFVVLVAAGVMYIVSAGNESLISSAKTAMKYALGGIIAMFVGWVVIATLINTLLPVNEAEYGLKGNLWSGYTCGGGVSESSGSAGNQQPVPGSGGNQQPNNNGGNQQPGNNNGNQQPAPVAPVAPTNTTN